jgi:GDP-4-dehydro-6-deoxy-D-mannose reductase
MKVLVTGADGFVGRYVLSALGAAGHEAIACHRAGVAVPAWSSDAALAGTEWRPLELGQQASVTEALEGTYDAVLHLAALSSGGAARRDPGHAWEVNAAGTARVVEAIAQGRVARSPGPLVIVVSTGEVYGSDGRVPAVESDPLRPVSPYAASKLGAEEAARETARRTGLRVIVARPFAHTGPRQLADFVVPAFVRRLRAARAAGERTVSTGNLDPVRDFLDVRDVARAYVVLLGSGVDGETYNIASGVGTSLRDLFFRLAALVGVEVEPVRDPALVRTADIPYLVGNAAKLTNATGWSPHIPLDQTLRDLTHAETD